MLLVVRERGIRRRICFFGEGPTHPTPHPPARRTHTRTLLACMLGEGLGLRTWQALNTASGQKLEGAGCAASNSKARMRSTTSEACCLKPHTHPPPASGPKTCCTPAMCAIRAAPAEALEMPLRTQGVDFHLPCAPLTSRPPTHPPIHPPTTAHAHARPHLRLVQSLQLLGTDGHLHVRAHVLQEVRPAEGGRLHS